MTKNTPFFPILHVFAPLNDVWAYIACPENNPKLREFFYEDGIQLQIQVAPPGRFRNKLQLTSFFLHMEPIYIAFISAC